MASEQEQINITIKAEGDLSTFQYRAVNVVASGYGTVSSGTADELIGILQNKPAAYGRAAKVCVAGHTKAIAGAAITSLGPVGVLNAGYLQTVATDGASIMGYNLTTASGSGSYFEMIVNPKCR